MFVKKNDYGDNDNEYGETAEEKKKRKRKTKEEVERAFKCLLTSCDKSYGFYNKLGKQLKSAY